MMKIKPALLIALALVGPLSAEPIQWRPWSEDVFEQAKREDKLVILDLEAVWCHWCHVMEEKTYNDPQVQQLISSYYIPVRVDQDSRPDLSNRYEDYGWPATIVFDAKGRELAKRAGYIPAPPMISMLQAFIKDPTPGPTGGEDDTFESTNDTALSAGTKKQLDKNFRTTYDPKFLGWGTVHKYLDPDVLEYAMSLAARGDAQAQTMARQTLDANLALIDPVWGGVYQYSASGRWNDPHFEKIMFFQAANLRTYANAYALWKNPTDLKAARDVYRFLTSFLMSPSGAFYTSQDADVIRGTHSADYFQKSDKDRRAAGLPKVDKHQYARENGWAIEALTALYSVTGEKTILAQATKAAEWVVANRSLPDGGFRHDETDTAGPYLGDSLAMARAFFSLYTVTGDRGWLKKATSTVDVIEKRFMSKNGYSTSPEATAGLAPKTQRDENVAAGRLFNLLHHATGDPRYRKMAEHAMKFLANPYIALRVPTASVLLTDAELSNDPMHITVIGPRKNATTQSLFALGLTAYPLTYRRIELWDRTEGPLPNSDVQYPELDQPAAFVCADGRCSLPLLTVEKLKSKIAKPQ